MSTVASNVFLGTGRRKTSTARVRISEGSGKLVCNGREFERYFSHENFAKQAYAPLLTVELKDKIDVTVNVAGGGVAGQAGAVAHGIARALQKMNAELRPALKKAGHLERDDRAKERKKPGQPGARKRFQFSKR
ncbi:MAG TPA: 30S ribosomal protein S9 [Opitutus sp.]|nr:30S ribosomal protein S9 [Opitutus sp.]